jgi:hypothetical protein
VLHFRFHLVHRLCFARGCVHRVQPEDYWLQALSPQARSAEQASSLQDRSAAQEAS